jgi:HlyD family type I secretion membrane fusion protein
MNALTSFATQPVPTPLETINDRLHGRLRRAMMAVGLLCFALFASAAIIDISGAVVGSGDIKVDSNVKRVAHPTGGIVAEILVKNGQKLTKGQPMIRLDTRVSELSAAKSSQSVAQLLAQKARLEAEANGLNTIRFPAELGKANDAGVSAAIRDAQQQFALQKRERAASEAQLRERIAQLNQQIIGFEKQKQSIVQQATLIKPELEAVRGLWERRLVTITRLNQLERTAIDLEGQTGSLEASIAQSRARITETREQLIQLTQTARSQAAAQLADINSRLTDQEVREVSTGEAFDKSVIRAPATGFVDKLMLSTIGGVVQPYEAIAEIVPIDDALVVETPINISDIDRVYVGQEARIHFSAFNSQTTPEIRGKVSWVSAEKTTNQQTGMSFYLVRVALDRAVLAKAKIPKLLPGMPAEVYIQTGSRSLLSYLTKPLRDQIMRSFRQE